MASTGIFSLFEFTLPVGMREVGCTACSISGDLLVGPVGYPKSRCSESGSGSGQSSRRQFLLHIRILDLGLTAFEDWSLDFRPEPHYVNLNLVDLELR